MSMKVIDFGSIVQKAAARRGGADTAEWAVKVFTQGYTASTSTQMPFGNFPSHPFPEHPISFLPFASPSKACSRNGLTPNYDIQWAAEHEKRILRVEESLLLSWHFPEGNSFLGADVTIQPLH
ncbi:hypothetical protein RB195_005940 [Necator americanus]|uniref:Uncharacterized protein n=1 Tax=Necator americanus TaxID=51031 RepID=A0ABR1BU29_NECAM